MERLPRLALTPTAGKGARLIIVNVDPTPADDLADVVFHECAGTVLPQIVAKIRGGPGGTQTLSRP